MSWANVAPVVEADEGGGSSPMMLSSTDVFNVCVGAVPVDRNADDRSAGGGGSNGGSGSAGAGIAGVDWRAYSLHDVRRLQTLPVPYAASGRRPRGNRFSPNSGPSHLQNRFHQLLLASPLDASAVHAHSLLHMMVQLHARTRVLVLSDHELDLAAESLHLAPSLIKLDARLDAVSLALIDEGGPAGRPQELLHAAMRKVRLEVAPPASHVARRATEAKFSIGLVQIDNLLPGTSHPVMMQSPRRRSADAAKPSSIGRTATADAGTRSARPSGDVSGSGSLGGVPASAVSIIVRRRASGQLQDVYIELQPTDLALEASFLLRLGQLLAGGDESSSRLVASLDRYGRVGKLEERLGAALAVPPDWSTRVPFYCDSLHIAEIDLLVSSRLDVEMGQGLHMFGAEPRRERSDGGSEVGGAGGAPLSSGSLSVPLISSLVDNLLQLMMVLIKGIGTNLANISGVPFHFEAMLEKHPLCTKSELVYKLGQRLSWQAAAQLGKLLGHSEMLGNPMGMIRQVGSGVAGAMQGVSRGIVRGDGDQIVRGGKSLLGAVVGGAAGLGARLTGSLHSIVQKLTNALLESGSGYALSIGMQPGRAAGVGGGALTDVRRGLHLSLKEAIKEEAKEALRRLNRSLATLLISLQSAHKNGTLGLARGVADGAINLVLLPIATTLETGAVVLHTVEQAARGAALDGPPPLLRPARSFHSELRLLPLRQCMMTVLELTVLELRCSLVQRGAVHIQTSIYEPSYRSRRSKQKTEPRGWLDGFRWEHTETHLVRSLDARLLVRVFSTGSHLPLRRRRCIGSVALRLSTIRALCQPASTPPPSAAGAAAGTSTAPSAGVPRMETVDESYYECPPRWFSLRLRAKRREALRAEEELTFRTAQRVLGRDVTLDSGRGYATVQSPERPSSRLEEEAESDAGESAAADVDAARESLISPSRTERLRRLFYRGPRGGEANGHDDSDGRGGVPPSGSSPPSLDAQDDEFEGEEEDHSDVEDEDDAEVDDDEDDDDDDDKGVSAAGGGAAGSHRRSRASSGGGGVREAWAHGRSRMPSLYEGEGEFDSEPVAVKLRFRCWTGPPNEAVDGGVMLGAARLGADRAGPERSVSWPESSGPPRRAILSSSSSRALIPSTSSRLTNESAGGDGGGTMSSASASTSHALVLAGSARPSPPHGPTPTIAPSISALPNALPLLLSAAGSAPPPIWLARMDALISPGGLVQQTAADANAADVGCTLSITGHHAATPREVGARRYVTYTIAVAMRESGREGEREREQSSGREPQSWRVSRRFSQFVELHHELWARHTAALARSGATLPGKFRLPFTGLDMEGRDRAPELDSYLQVLLGSEELRRSEQLVYFLGANTPVRRRLWQAAVAAERSPRENRNRD